MPISLAASSAWIDGGFPMTKKIIFATRPSALARWQTTHIIQKLHNTTADLDCQEVVITTKGDLVIDQPLPEIGGKGLFTHELEQALRDGRVDAAVHSLKDLPTEEAPGLTIAAITQRSDARDVWICSAGHSLDNLPAGGSVGTSSTRRSAQLLAYRPDLQVRPIRGNVDTRLRKVRQGQYDAIILAAAGIIRLGQVEHITHYLPFDLMLPAPGQGALAVECRADDLETLTILRNLDHSPTRLAVTSERAYLEALGGGCSLPVGALARVDEHTITLQGLVAAPDGSQTIHLTDHGSDPQALGFTLAQGVLAQGADQLLTASH
jgi:hydroxymethylbilane synthase